MASQRSFRRHKPELGATHSLRLARAALTRTNVVAAAFLASQTPAHPEFLLEGSRERLVVKAHDTLLSDIFDALGSKFDVHLNSPIALEDRVDGDFSAPLTFVIGRLLQSYNYVLAQGQGLEINSIVIIVLGRKGIDRSSSSQVLPPPIGAPKIRSHEGGN
jgi:hypothetical protein